MEVQNAHRVFHQSAFFRTQPRPQEFYESEKSRPLQGTFLRDSLGSRGSFPPGESGGNASMFFKIPGK